MRRLGLRRRLLVAQIVTVAVAVAGLVAAFNIVLAHTLDRSARDLARSRAATQAASLRLEHGRLAVGGTPDDRSADSYVWVFAGPRLLDRPRAPAAADTVVRRLIDRPGGFADVASTDTRLFARPILHAGRRVGTVVAGVSLAPYEETRATALVASLILGAVVLALVAVAGWWVLGASLSPVVRMTRQASEWSEHDLDHRFALGQPHDELTELAATLDSLLDRISASLRRERRFSAELSHELRTPLARVMAQAELALRRRREPEDYEDTLRSIHANAEQLSRTVDALVAAARYEAGGERGTSDAADVAAEAVEACTGLAHDRGLDVRLVRPSRPLRVGVDADLAERVLQPVVENACRYAASSVSVAISRADSAITFAIEDDGPGLADEERDRIFEPGVRGAAGVAGGGGAGLGLALSRRLAHTVDGEVEAGTAAAGARFLVRLPTA